LACEKILNDCAFGNEQLRYIDLCLIHWPGSQKIKPSSTQNYVNRIQTWKIMTKYYKAGKFKNIGVSNFTKVHLEELLDLSETDKELYKIRPSVVQNENHIFYCDEEALKFCNTKGIFYQSYFLVYLIGLSE